MSQEAFLEIWRSSAQFAADRGSAVSWILTIAHRRAVDRVRSAGASTRRETTHHRQTQAGHGLRGDDTAAAAMASDEASRVRRALSVLSVVQREAIDLAYFGGFTHAEIAVASGVPLGTTKTRIRDGLLKPRVTLGEGLVQPT